MNYYFIKQNEMDNSFIFHLSENDLLKEIQIGKIKPEWLITLNTFGESYKHFIRNPHTPSKWISVKSFIENKDENIFHTDFYPPIGEGLSNFKLWSFKGRINIIIFWAILLAAGIIDTLLGFFLNFLADANTVIALIYGVIVIVLICWVTLATMVKRWHDRNKSGWMVLINLIPIIGIIWSFIELGFLSGTKWANKYGSDPSY